MSVYILRAFVQLRELLTSNKELAKRLDGLEARVTHDQAVTEIIKAIRQLAAKKRSIGFVELEERKTRR